MKRRSPCTATIAGLRGTSVSTVLAAATLTGAVLALSGCQAFSPTQTNVPYQPADGVAVELGEIQIRNLVVVAPARGAVGTLSGLVINKGTAPATVTFSTGPGGSAQATVPARGQTRLSGVPGAMPVTFPSIAAAPGDIVKVTVRTPAAGAPAISVPVLPPTGYYASLTAAPPQTPAPSRSAAPPRSPSPS